MGLIYLRHWVHRNRRVLTLKVAVAALLLISHYFPESGVSVWVNLIWLALF